MRRGFFLALLLTGSLGASIPMCAQNQPHSDAASPDQKKPAAADANPFPDDTSDVPVMPAKGALALPEDSSAGNDSSDLHFPEIDADPARNPDDSTDGKSAQDENSSSSLANIDKLLPMSDDDAPDSKKKLPTHQETAAKDIEVGGYYLDRKNWKAAQSRFESAMVLDPENPEVYWGLAEADRHLGEYADARSYYLKLLDYDPDGPHGRAARKALKDSEVANGHNAIQQPAAAEPAR